MRNDLSRSSGTCFLGGVRTTQTFKNNLTLRAVVRAVETMLCDARREYLERYSWRIRDAKHIRCAKHVLHTCAIETYPIRFIIFSAVLREP